MTLFPGVDRFSAAKCAAKWCLLLLQVWVKVIHVSVNGQVSVNKHHAEAKQNQFGNASQENWRYMSFLVASVQNPPKGHDDITVDKCSENKWIKQAFFIPLTFSTKGDILEKLKFLHISPFFFKLANSLYSIPSLNLILFLKSLSSLTIPCTRWMKSKVTWKIFDNLSIQKYNSYRGNQGHGSEVLWQWNLNKGYQQFQINWSLNEILRHFFPVGHHTNFQIQNEIGL